METETEREKKRNTHTFGLLERRIETVMDVARDMRGERQTGGGSEVVHTAVKKLKAAGFCLPNLRKRESGSIK